MIKVTIEELEELRDIYDRDSYCDRCGTANGRSTFDDIIDSLIKTDGVE